MKNIKKFTLLSFILIFMLTSAGCTDYSFKSDLIEIPLGTQINDKHGLPSFLDIYEAWKYDVDTLYIQAGTDEYTNTYLLERIPSAFSTLINSTNEYNMNVYAFLDGGIWLKDSDVNLVSKEVLNILTYNKKYKDKRFKGVNIGINLDNVSKEDLECYYNNLKETRKLINLHNKYGNDSLKLSINLDENIINNLDFIDKIVSLVDEIIYVNLVNKYLIENGEKMLSIIDQYEDKKVDIMIDFDKVTINANSVNLIKEIDENIVRFNEYKSFNGFMINNHKNYIKCMKTIKTIS